MSTPVWVSRKQIADVFGISTQTVLNAINAGAAITVKYVGRKPLYRVADIDRWIESLPDEWDGAQK